MKGVTLAIETIIVIILAVTVLSVLLFFFRSQFTETSNIVELINLQTTNCNGYVYYDFNCDGTMEVTMTDNVLLTKLGKACGGLFREKYEYPACAGITESHYPNPGSPGGIACIQQCCRMMCAVR